MGFNTPRQFRPQRALLEAATGLDTPQHSTTGFGLNLGSNPLTNPAGQQLNTYIIGCDDVEFSHSFVVGAGNFLSYTTQGIFTNLPFTQPQQNPGNSTNSIAGPLVVPTNAILLMYVTASLLNQPSANVIVAAMSAQPQPMDSTGFKYQVDQHAFPGGTTYNRFAVSTTVLVYSPGGVTATVNWGVRAILAIAFPGKAMTNVT